MISLRKKASTSYHGISFTGFGLVYAYENQGGSGCDCTCSDCECDSSPQTDANDIAVSYEYSGDHQGNDA